MPEPKALIFYPFGKGDPLSAWEDVRQIRYLRFYLEDLSATTVLEEPYYFDRDYLAEFSAFYALSSRGYPNTCRRLHFFSIQVDRPLLLRAAGGDPSTVNTLQKHYLGFVVIRPLSGAPLGRTVLKWYPERTPLRPRITNPKRQYTSHVAGIELTVDGLAWQQQDTAVGACATIALWSVLHSAALDEWHSVPTTADITRFAHRTASMGSRIFPTNGLTSEQIREAIKEAGLEPVFLKGDVFDTREWYFSRQKFSVTCAALIRSGFPVLLFAEASSELHAVCIVGFRAGDVPVRADEDGVILADTNLQYVYLHDDNLGPSVRFEIVETGDTLAPFVELQPSSPERQSLGTPLPDPCADYGRLRPAYIVAAVPSDLRISPDALHKQALNIAATIAEFLEDLPGDEPPDVSASTRFFYLTDYLSYELVGLLKNHPGVLARARMAITENVAPMSRILGVVRVGIGDKPLADVLFDSSEGDNHLSAFCTMVFSKSLFKILKAAIKSGLWPHGVLLDAVLPS